MAHTDVDASLNAVTGTIVDAAFRVHTILGPGLHERLYTACLSREIEKRGLVARREVLLPVFYDGERLDGHYRADLLVAERVPVEVKAVETVLAVHISQLRTYLRVGGFPVGLLLNFNTPWMRTGVYREVCSAGSAPPPLRSVGSAPPEPTFKPDPSLPKT